MEAGFFIKKLITFFIEPLGLVLTLFALGLIFLYRGKKPFASLFLSTSFALLFIFSYQPFSNFLVSALESGYEKYGYKDEIKYVHVLGSGHSTESYKPLSSQISGSGMKRVLEGIIIHLNTPGSKIIFTGYEGNTDVPNAIMNAKLARALGVKAENIVIGEKPKDTYEEALFAKSVVGDKAFALVTSASHMPRAMRLFRSAGLNPIAAPTDFHKKESSSLLSAPGTGQLENSRMAVHEYLGILWSMIKR